MNIRLLLPLLLAATMPVMADNEVKTVSQVTTSVTLSTPTDYTITSSTPFTTTGSVNIESASGGVVILRSLKPSLAQDYLPFIRINGQVAELDANCQLRIYGGGTMVLPYSAAASPATLYAGDNQSGDSLNLAESDAMKYVGVKMNNRVRSFRLKRGYMLTLANYSDGTGYSRVYIADKTDRLVNLEQVQRDKVSSARVLPWNNVNKRGFGGTNQSANSALNTTWCYGWDAADMKYMDREYVTQHHHEGWPSIYNCGKNGTSPNLLGNNEPDNTADARETVSSVSEVLKNWPQMMATGKRLGSPAMSSNLTWLYQFIDSIDAYGWRCDFVAVHAYWYSDWSSWQSQLQAIHDRTGRPIWITEMNYGANWTGWPGSNTNGTAENYRIELQHMKPIIDGLESTGWIERYAIYNAVQDCRRAWDGSKVTPMGEYYANKSSSLAFNYQYGVTPKSPTMHDPTDFSAFYNPADSTTSFSWHEPNGEFNRSMTLEVQRGSDWAVVDTLTQKEQAADYSVTLKGLENGQTYRIHVVTLNGVNRYSNISTSAREKDHAGDIVKVNGKDMYLGGNIIVNGDFDYGTYGWNNGKGNAIGQPDFEVIPFGSKDGGSYLQSWTHTGSSDAGALNNVYDLQKNSYYFFGVMAKNNSGTWQKLSLSADGNAETETVSTLTDCGIWTKQTATFNSGDYSKAVLRYRWLDSKAQYDKFYLGRLFDTREEALADAESLARLTEGMTTTAEQQRLDSIASLKSLAQHILPFNLPGKDELEYVASNSSDVSELAGAISQYLPSTISSRFVTTSFNGSYDGWTVKAGTYQGGDQRTASNQVGKSCWNAWWSGLDAANDTATMAIWQRQRVAETGFYHLAVKASTQHYCLSDQHAYMTLRGNKILSDTLSWDYLDVPDASAEQVWQTLTTEPVYVNEGDTLTIGFEGSKQGAVNNAWSKYGDNSSTGDQREGWWCATDFNVVYTPALCLEAEPDTWNTITLPYDGKPGYGVEAYSVAGIDSDGTKLWLDRVETMEAGMPYIYRSKVSDVTFLESGAKVSSAKKSPTGLCGTFHPSKRSISDIGFALVDGRWISSTPETTALVNNMAYLATQDKIPYTAPTDISIPIEGAVATAITLRKADLSDGDAPAYNTAGQRVGSGYKGIVISKGKKTVK